MKEINSFSEEHDFLSNFAPSPFALGGDVWPTVEHAFQAKKTWDSNDRRIIKGATTPGKAKRLGRKVVMRDDWEFEKVHVMLKLVRKKFEQNHDLAEKLIATGTATLIEGNNWHDNFWGDCSCIKGVCLLTGQNMLGKILMLVREELRA